MTAAYTKEPDNPKRWIIDEDAAPVVRRIFDMSLSGYGIEEIAVALDNDGVLTPTAYWKSKGTGRGGIKTVGSPTRWRHSTVAKILDLQEYCGDIINFKTFSKSYKLKKRIVNPEENRTVFLNVHEAIIDRATWERIQRKHGTRKHKPTVSGERSIFSGLLKCPECGGNINYHFIQGNPKIKFFSCVNHNAGRKVCSSTHYIRVDFLEAVVLQEIRRLTQFANQHEDKFLKAIVGHSIKSATSDWAKKQQELDRLSARDQELDALFERLYEDNVSGKIDDRRFTKMSQKYEQEQGENAAKIKVLNVELTKESGQRMTADVFLETVRRYTDVQELSQRMVVELIDHIDVYQSEKVDGQTTQRLEIFYNCVGAFTVPELGGIPEIDVCVQTRTGVALNYTAM